jgi:N-acetylmuramoyl-L-alanine amidase
MLNRHSIFVGVTALLLLLPASAFAPTPSPISVFAPRTTYHVDVGARDGVDYAGLTDLLEPLGQLEAKVSGSVYLLTFNGRKSEFREGKRQVRAIGQATVELTAPFVMVDNRGYIPVVSIERLLSQITGRKVAYHAASRRLFIDSPEFSFTAVLRHDPSRLELSFPSPVKPSITIEKGRVRLLFEREPVVGSGPDEVSYHDPFVQSTRVREVPGGMELTARVGLTAKVSVSDDGRTVTIHPAPGAVAETPPAAPAPPPAPAAPSASQRASAAPAAPGGPPFVILDAAHGGSENGAALSSELMEKTVTLEIARRLQKDLEARGVPVALIRTGDILLSWDQRAEAANTSHALLYVALHASADGHGVRLYTAMLQEESVSGAGKKNRPGFVPWEKAQSPYLLPSRQAAAAVVAQCKTEGLPARESSAPVAPLNNVTMAAVAVEVAPLGKDVNELATTQYQQKIASVLAKGIAGLRGRQRRTQ